MTKGSGELLVIDWANNELPTLPSIAHKLITMASSDEAGPNELSELIGQDPSLTMKVLRAANSAFYALQIEVTSIKHAIVLLGMQEVRRIAIGSVLAERFLSVAPEAKKEAEDLWRHLLATAVLAQDLTRTGEEEPDLYTLGLLHDLGWLVLLAEAPKVYKSLVDEKELSLAQVERNWGVDHQFWGARLAERWSMPEPFQVVNLRHHNPLADFEPTEYLIAIYLANHMAEAIGFRALEAELEPIEPKALERIGLDEETFIEMIQAAQGERDRIDALWSTMVG